MENQPKPSKYSLPPEDFQFLLSKVTEASCFKRTYKTYILISIVTLIGLSTCLFIVTLSDNIWLQIINAIALAFFSVQLGLIGHDLSHGAVFYSKKINRNLALIVWGLGCGLSEGRWFYKHNAHHQAPNHIGHDPDLEIPFVFSHEQTEKRSTFFKKWILPYQHLLFWFGLWFVYPYNILNSMRFLFSGLTRRSLLEIILISIHFFLLLTFTTYFLPLTTALVFNLTIFFIMGIYMGLIFAPNHKGEDMLNESETHNWVHQITLTRNIYPSRIISYLLGGLEHQIEHHLFPSMPRFKYSYARKIVIGFCKERNLPYHQTTWLESLKQIHEALKKEASV